MVVGWSGELFEAKAVEEEAVPEMARSLRFTLTYHAYTHTHTMHANASRSARVLGLEYDPVTKEATRVKRRPSPKGEESKGAAKAKEAEQKEVRVFLFLLCPFSYFVFFCFSS